PAAKKRFKRQRGQSSHIAGAAGSGSAATYADGVPLPPAGQSALTAPPVAESTAEIMERAAKEPPDSFQGPEDRPELPYPDRSGLPQNPDSPAVGSVGDFGVTGPAAGAQSAAAWSFVEAPMIAQTLGTSFTGASVFGTNPTNTTPPDSMGAVGPTQYIVAVNGRIVSFNKSTGVADGVLNATTNSFFTSVRNGSGTSDPRIRYDRLTSRWFIIIINVATPNRVLVALSDSASAGIITAGTVWAFYQFTNAAGATCLADYPTLGIDKNALYIGVNNFCGSPSQTFAGTDGYVMTKAPMLTGSSTTVTRFPFVTSSTGAGPHTPQGVDNYDPGATEGYFIGVDNATFGKLMLRRVTNPGGSPSVSANIAITVATTS